MQKTEIPIYIANGSRDQNPVLSADYTKLEFLREGKPNITYRVYPDYNHQFTRLVFEDGELKQEAPKIAEVTADAFEWLRIKRRNPED